MEGLVVDDLAGRSDIVLRRPYARIEGKVWRENGAIRVRFTSDSFGADGTIETCNGEETLTVNGSRIHFRGMTFEPCDWVDGGRFYVTFCQFPYQYGYAGAPQIR